MMEARIINQPWEDVASDVTDAIEKAVQPLLRKAVDEVYRGLLETTQDYLKENLAFNIASRIDSAESQAYADRLAAEKLKSRCYDLMAALTILKPIMATAESNASGNPEWDDINRRLTAVRRVMEAEWAAEL